MRLNAHYEKNPRLVAATRVTTRFLRASEYAR